MAKRIALLDDPLYQGHDTGNHPENARRLKEIKTWLKQPNFGSPESLSWLQPRDATEHEILAVHPAQHLNFIKNWSAQGGGFLDLDTTGSAGSYRAAVRAAGAAVQGVELVLEATYSSAFALVRPPGHHAGINEPAGFCLFNNAAIAARYALEKYGLERILIIDWDVHHGNGTQEIFYTDNQVLYFSTHQYPFYPGTGNYTEIGEGKGKGYTLNVPLPAGTGDAEYLEVFETILAPAARRFQPQLIIVSAGYDAHYADPLAQMNLTGKGYEQLSRVVYELAQEICQDRVVFVLEGGYHPLAMASAVGTTIATFGDFSLIEDPYRDLPQTITHSVDQRNLKEFFSLLKRLHRFT